MELDHYQINQLYDQVEQETDTSEIYRLYGIICDTLKLRAQKNPSYNLSLAETLNDKAWFGFFLSNFADSETAIREGLALDQSNQYLATNLPHALLFQGKIKMAQALYKQYKNQSFEEDSAFKDVFLEDLALFQKAGIIPAELMKDVEKIRAMLGK